MPGAADELEHEVFRDVHAAVSEHGDIGMKFKQSPFLGGKGMSQGKKNRNGEENGGEPEISLLAKAHCGTRPQFRRLGLQDY